MKETSSISVAGDAEPAARPSYDQIGQRLTALLESAGGRVTEEFPRFAPRGAMTAYDHATGTLVLHPWISPRARAEALLRETVAHLVEHPAKPRKTRGKEVPAPRDWVVREEVARRYDLAPVEGSQRGVEVTGTEQALIDRIVAAVDGPAEPEEGASSSL